MIEKVPQIKTWLMTNGKVVFLLMTMVIGALIPQAQVLAFMVQYLLMTMLFFAFLDLPARKLSIQPGVIKVLLANLLLGIGWYFLFSLVDHELAMTAFICAMAPTAISSTVIVGFIRGKVDFMVAAVLFTNIVAALVIPFILPNVVGTNVQISTWDVLLPVLITMFVPLILARLSTHLPQRAQKAIHTGKKLSFPVWLLNLFIISAKASHFMINERSGSLLLFFQVAGVALLICVVNFVIGAILGGREYWQESSQALGQKNTTFAIWIALAFMSPLVAMGPTIYTFFHHLYNTWQIYRFEKRKKESLCQKQISV
jgi:BASS family bile acid:Na+ symporter